MGIYPPLHRGLFVNVSRINGDYLSTQQYIMGYTFSVRVLTARTATRKHAVLGQKYFNGGGKHTIEEGAKNTKHNKINNNSEYLEGARLLLGEGFRP